MKALVPKPRVRCRHGNTPRNREGLDVFLKEILVSASLLDTFLLTFCNTRTDPQFCVYFPMHNTFTKYLCSLPNIKLQFDSLKKGGAEGLKDSKREERRQENIWKIKMECDAKRIENSCAKDLLLEYWSRCFYWTMIQLLPIHPFQSSLPIHLCLK